jgi:ribosomal protein S18 acetylase RimI-like enzyme
VTRDSTLDVRLTPVAASDADELASLRVLAMRESLERIGRFELKRARARFLNDFVPANTRFIELAGVRVGLVVTIVTSDKLQLDHLYIHPEAQNKGVGSAVLAEVFAEAARLGLTTHVCVLRESDANRFYTRHGFVLITQTRWDNQYQRRP